MGTLELRPTRRRRSLASSSLGEAGSYWVMILEKDEGER